MNSLPYHQFISNQHPMQFTQFQQSTASNINYNQDLDSDELEQKEQSVQSKSIPLEQSNLQQHNDEPIQKKEKKKRQRKNGPKMKKLISDLQLLSKGIPNYKPKFNYGLSNEIQRIQPSPQFEIYNKMFEDRVQQKVQQLQNYVFQANGYPQIDQEQLWSNYLRQQEEIQIRKSHVKEDEYYRNKENCRKQYIQSQEKRKVDNNQDVEVKIIKSKIKRPRKRQKVTLKNKQGKDEDKSIENQLINKQEQETNIGDQQNKLESEEVKETSFLVQKEDLKEIKQNQEQQQRQTTQSNLAENTKQIHQTGKGGKSKVINDKVQDSPIKINQGKRQTKKQTKMIIEEKKKEQKQTNQEIELNKQQQHQDQKNIVFESQNVGQHKQIEYDKIQDYHLNIGKYQPSLDDQNYNEMKKPERIKFDPEQNTFELSQSKNIFNQFQDESRSNIESVLPFNEGLDRSTDRINSGTISNDDKNFNVPLSSSTQQYQGTAAQISNYKPEGSSFGLQNSVSGCVLPSYSGGHSSNSSQYIESNTNERLENMALDLHSHLSTQGAISDKHSFSLPNQRYIHQNMKISENSEEALLQDHSRQNKILPQPQYYRHQINYGPQSYNQQGYQGEPQDQMSSQLLLGSPHMAPIHESLANTNSEHSANINQLTTSQQPTIYNKTLPMSKSNSCDYYDQVQNYQNYQLQQPMQYPHQQQQRQMYQHHMIKNNQNPAPLYFQNANLDYQTKLQILQQFGVPPNQLNQYFQPQQSPNMIPDYMGSSRRSYYGMKKQSDDIINTESQDSNNSHDRL